MAHNSLILHSKQKVSSKFPLKKKAQTVMDKVEKNAEV